MSCPGPGWQRVVLDEADCGADAERTITVDALRASVHADAAVAIDAALADFDPRVRTVAKAKARVLIDERLDIWETGVRTALSGIH